MSRQNLCRVAFVAIIMPGLLALQSGCQQKLPVTWTEPPVTSWTCDRMLEVQKEWKTLNDSFDDRWTKENYTERTRKLQGVLKKRLSPQDMAGRPAQAPAAREKSR